MPLDSGGRRGGGPARNVLSGDQACSIKPDDRLLPATAAAIRAR